ncbi:MAG TPA: LysR substrate-binding domain-containing protein [Chitinophagales bacterium]|nr:LysR substrate-binding domain-containing protein [Chitinophagales bacterium]
MASIILIMTLQQLEYVIALDNHRNYVKAAKSCYVTQPTLSMMVKKLEDEIGVSIFDRNKKPLQPTKTGVEIISKARQILREVNYLKAYVNKETENIEGEYTIGIIPTVAPYLLPLFITAFTNRYPRTYLNIKEMQTDQIIDGLNKGTIELGIAATPLETSSLREIPIYNEPFLLYDKPNDSKTNASKNINPSQLDINDIILMDEGHCFRDQALALCGNKKARKHKFPFEYKSGSIEAIKNLVDKGMGKTLVPELSVLGETNRKNITRFKSPEPVRVISLIVHKSFTKEALIEALHGIISSAVPDRFTKKQKFKRVKWR